MPIFNYGDLTDRKLFEGQYADLMDDPEARTGINADTQIIIFGRGVVQGSGDKDVLLPSSASDTFLGIALYTETFEKRADGTNQYLNSIDPTTGKMGYPLKHEVAYVVDGAVGVLIDGPVTPKSPVYCRFAGGAKGVFRADADTSNAFLVNRARFLKSGVAGDVVPLSIELP